VKFKTEVLTSLVDAEDPVDPVWEAVWNIWAPAGDDIASHYSREPEMVEYERLLLDVYSEFYTETLTDRCVNQASMNVPEEGALIMMDSMSVREASLFVQFLEDKAVNCQSVTRILLFLRRRCLSGTEWGTPI